MSASRQGFAHRRTRSPTPGDRNKAQGRIIRTRAGQTQPPAKLEKPGRGPRPEFKTAAFKERVNILADLQPGMLLEGVASNVTTFGAFVDIRVQHDKLVLISALTNRFVKDRHEVVKASDVVKVRVVSIIALFMPVNEVPGR